MVVIALLFATAVHADGRPDYLIRLLRNSDAFRVRAQAALSLGQLDPSPKSVAALERAARDRHPAVRVSAISSLRRLGAKEALPTLRQTTRDRNKSVRRAAAEAVAELEAIGQRRRGPGEPRHLVAVGMPGARAERVSRQMLFDARIFLSEKLTELAGVELAPDDLSPADAKREIAQRRLHGYYLESSIVTLKPKGNGVRAEVSIIMLTYPGRDMRAMLRGAATASGRYSAETAEQAIHGAFVGALRRLPQALAAADAKGSL
ncbi:MAG: HEAT repeat domain-containing protein [Myxococcales bacterium]|nr:HEAT repeat domain-containing protein [Myxococcales bacterium]MDH3483408.1 HEAT repeat domain-containing protein [Myxococcales bacterium]